MLNCDMCGSEIDREVEMRRDCKIDLGTVETEYELCGDCVDRVNKFILRAKNVKS